MRLMLGAMAMSIVVLVALGAPPMPVLLGASISSALIWWRSAGAR